MTSRVEEALLALFAKLEDAAGDGLPAPVRNQEVATLLSMIEGGGAALNLVDGSTDVDDVQLGDGRTYDLTHRAVIEWLVENADQAARDTAFDAGLEAIADVIEADETLDGTVDDAVIENISRSGHVTDGAPQIKSAAITVALTLTSSRPF